MTIGNIPGYSPGYSPYTNTTAPVAANTVNPLDKPEEKSANPDDTKKAGRRSAPSECETCANRKYQDGSDEGNVSFKAAAHISPEAAGRGFVHTKGNTYQTHTKRQRRKTAKC